MHLSIRHEITCRFAAPVRNLVAILRLSPRSHEGQHVTGWRLDPNLDCSLKAGRDEFGNVTHTFSARGPLSEVRILATGEIDTFDTAGIVRGTVEPLPLEVFLRDTPLTSPDQAVRTFAETAVGAEVAPLGRLHALLKAIHAEVRCDPSLEASAAETLARKTGNAMGHAHLFIACTRHLGIPSRLAAGYLVRQPDGKPACHAWAEAYVPQIGWIGFDTVSDICPKGEHVRCAAALDGLGAAFVRGTHPDRPVHRLEIAAVA
jgi:transglutaminase-like putative cysteine protease